LSDQTAPGKDTEAVIYDMQDKKNENFDSKGNRIRIRTLWNKSSDEYYQKRNAPSVMHKLRDSPGMVFHQTVYSDIQDLLTEKHIKKVCVLGSGDNEAVFAFHFLGTEVTSVDISEKQIENARMIADKQGMNIRFVVSDILDLRSIANGGFDMVYTSNGVLT
jgi:2-polyprenyl-3-methyl-5-hydroxy-6-metoxy-1,4-benzoquinol methylase